MAEVGYLLVGNVLGRIANWEDAQHASEVLCWVEDHAEGGLEPCSCLYPRKDVDHLQGTGN